MDVKKLADTVKALSDGVDKLSKRMDAYDPYAYFMGMAEKATNAEDKQRFQRMAKEERAKQKEANKPKPKGEKFTTHPLGGFKNQSVSSQLNSYKR
jgi:hypothetical protein